MEFWRLDSLLGSLEGDDKILIMSNSSQRFVALTRSHVVLDVLITTSREVPPSPFHR